ncbi:MAG: geranylgeranyl reductase family protein, partial [Candidatus Diapherotrites archaeon]|nr:geranylgeranyl reductase family protein [Candidatus Diapherotrites archaeon]
MVKSAQNTFDVIVCGGGPGGSSATFFLSQKGFRVLLLEKAGFPRDKTCGDAISGKSAGILRKMGLFEEAGKLPHGSVNGVIFSSPNATQITIPFPGAEKGRGEGYVIRREVYDNFLFQNAKKKATQTMEGFMVTDTLKEGEQIVGVKGMNLKTQEESEFYAPLVVGADGAKSIIAEKTGLGEVHLDHQCVAVRAYYENIANLSPNIEIHFINSVLPGYFWIFPVEGNKANVGIGMITSDMQKQKKKLMPLML